MIKADTMTARLSLSSTGGATSRLPISSVDTLVMMDSHYTRPHCQFNTNSNFTNF